MFHFRNEGEVSRQGFNVYRRHTGSLGFILRIGKWFYMFRWSKKQRRLITGWSSE